MEDKEITLENAEIDDVDFILDLKLDIILNNKNVLNMNKFELEKTVLEEEEKIRENLNAYKIIKIEMQKIGFICTNEIENELQIDGIYILQNYRNNGACTFVIKEIIKNNFKPIRILIDKNDSKMVELFEKLDFYKEEQIEDKICMICQNDKKENDILKAEMVCNEVAKLCEKYKLKYFFYTENKSITNLDEEDLDKFKIINKD